MPGDPLMTAIRTIAVAAAFAVMSFAAMAQTDEENTTAATSETESATEEAAAPAPIDPLFQMIESVPVTITDLRLVGEWSEGDEVGIFRTIITQDMVLGGASRLFVQWLVPGETGPQIKHQIEIKELIDERINIVDFTAETDQQLSPLFIPHLGCRPQSPH